MPFDGVKDFTPISLLAYVTNTMVINPAVPATTLAEFIAYGKANPGKIAYASAGQGSTNHLCAALFAKMTGIEMVHVPYRGGAPVVTDLLSGQIAMSMATASNFAQHAAAGKLRLIAAATEKRLALYPDLPTVGETIPGYAVEVFVAVAAPAGTPADILTRISADIAEIVANPAYREKNLTAVSLEPVGSTREEFAAVLARDNARWRALVERTGIRID
jgi:tripartite-type tricarboxylate transporter receptor subunit TctC